MKKMTPLFLLILCGGMAQTDERPRERGERDAESTRVRKATTVIGASVTVQRGELTFGKVTDLVISENGCIDFLVVDYDDSLVLVPWGVTTYSVEKRTIVITQEITREQLRAVAFTRGNWPDPYAAAYTGKLRTSWGEKGLRGDRGTVRPDDKKPDPNKDRKDGADKDSKPTDRKPPTDSKVSDKEKPKDKPARDKDKPKIK